MPSFPVATFNSLWLGFVCLLSTNYISIKEKKFDSSQVKVHAPYCKSGRVFWSHTVVSGDSITELPNTDT